MLGGQPEKGIFQELRNMKHHQHTIIPLARDLMEY